MQPAKILRIFQTPIHTHTRLENMSTITFLTHDDSLSQQYLQSTTTPHLDNSRFELFPYGAHWSTPLPLTFVKIQAGRGRITALYAGHLNQLGRQLVVGRETVCRPWGTSTQPPPATILECRC